MDNFTKIESFWQSLNYSDFNTFKLNIDKLYPTLFNFLIQSLFKNDVLEIGLHTLNKITASCVSYDIYEYTKGLTLRYLSITQVNFLVFLEDDDGEIHYFNYSLNENEIKINYPSRFIKHFR